MFPHIPNGCLKRPNMEVGILLGQNANALLPTGGTGRYKVGNLRIRRSLLGKQGYLLEGWHAGLRRAKKSCFRVQSLKAKSEESTKVKPLASVHGKKPLSSTVVLTEMSNQETTEMDSQETRMLGNTLDRTISED